MTELKSDEAIEALAVRVLDASLPKSEWTHAAHFALALYLLRYRRELAEPDAMREIITRLNEAHGTPNTDSEGYHHTITIASLAAARGELERYPDSVPLAEILENLLSTPLGKFDWIFAFWSPEVLFSLKARRGWLEPDRQVLPF